MLKKNSIYPKKMEFIQKKWNLSQKNEIYPKLKSITQRNQTWLRKGNFLKFISRIFSLTELYINLRNLNC